jgi:hypothetical protein
MISGKREIISALIKPEDQSVMGANVAAVDEEGSCSLELLAKERTDHKAYAMTQWVGYEYHHYHTRLDRMVDVLLAADTVSKISEVCAAKLLYLAAAHTDKIWTTVLRALIDRGVDINSISAREFGRFANMSKLTPLQVAIEKEATTNVALLASSGCTFSSQRELDETVAIVSQLQQQTSDDNTLYVKCLTDLIEKGASLNDNDSKLCKTQTWMPLLMVAVEQRNLEFVRFLLQKGVS